MISWLARATVPPLELFCVNVILKQTHKFECPDAGSSCVSKRFPPGVQATASNSALGLRRHDVEKSQRVDFSHLPSTPIALRWPRSYEHCGRGGLLRLLAVSDQPNRLPLVYFNHIGRTCHRRRGSPSPTLFPRKPAESEPFQNAFSDRRIGVRGELAPALIVQPLNDSRTHRSTRPVVSPLNHIHYGPPNWVETKNGSCKTVPAPARQPSASAVL